MRKKVKKSATELRWVNRVVCETQWFLVEVTKGASTEKILEACLEGDALYGTPHDTVTKQSDTYIGDTISAKFAKKFGKPIDLTEETA